MKKIELLLSGLILGLLVFLFVFVFGDHPAPGTLGLPGAGPDPLTPQQERGEGAKSAGPARYRSQVALHLNRDRAAPTLPAESGLPKANIGFGRLLSDAEVLAWLEAHDVEPRAFFMRSPGGFNGAHRIYDDEGKSVEELLAEARAQTIQSFEESLDGNLVRLQHFAEQYSREEVSTNGDLQEQARALLTLRSAFVVSHDAALTGAPLIYSVEVEVPTDALGTLQSEHYANALDTKFAEAATVPRTDNPFANLDSYVDPLVQDMTIDEIYQEIQRLGEDAPDPTMTGSELQGARP